MSDIERYGGYEGYVPGQLVRSKPDVDSWVHVLVPVGDLAAKIAGTDFVPAAFRGKPAAVTGAILFGREVGLPPMTALKNTYVVHGTPDLSAEAQRALVLAAGHEIEFIETTATRCRMRGRRTGSETWTEASYTMDEAKQSGDFKKNQNYATRGQEMMVARCTSRLCSMIYADVIGGYSAAVNAPLLAGDGVDSDTDPEASTVTVRQEPARKPPGRRKPKTAPKLPASEQAADGPPLPGEDGYDQLTSEAETVQDEPVAVEASPAQIKALHAALAAAGYGTREDKLAFCADLVGRELGSSKDLTADEVSRCLDVLKADTPAPDDEQITDGEVVE